MKKINIGIIDLKLNNLFSLHQACKNTGYKTSIIDVKTKKYNYDIIILPGVGTFRAAMKYLKKKEKIIFGICLGMQLLLEESEEFGVTRGLGLIEGKVKKINKFKNTKIPHIGWNNLKITKNKKNFLNNSFNKEKFYFVHSYYCDVKFKEQICSYTNYGKLNFCSSLRKDNIIGSQFHPEKSGHPGIKILSNLHKLL